MDKNKMDFQIKKLLRKENMAVCVLIGILLLVVAIPIGNPHENNEANVEETHFLGEVNGDDEGILKQNGSNPANMQNSYIEDMEAKVEKILSDMEGVGQAKVMITLKASREYMVEKDTPTNRSTVMEEDSGGGKRTTNENEMDEKTIYTVDGNGNEVPYVVKIKEPEIEGITVVATGGADPVVKSEITAVLQALFPLDAHKIIVVKMK